MITLRNGDILEVKTTATPTTALVWQTAWCDITKSSVSAANPDGSIGTFNQTDTTIVAAPASGDIRQVNYINLYNADNIAHTVTVQVDVSATNRVLRTMVLQVGWSAIYTVNTGWKIVDALGQERLGGGTLVNNGGVLSSLSFTDLANITTSTSMVSNTSYAVYVGVANKASTSISVRFRVTTAGVGTLTWAECGIFTGAFNVGGNATLTRLGFNDISGNTAGTALVTTTITLSTGVNIGDPIWVAFGGQYATTQWQARGTLADDLSSGVYQSLSGRISTVSSPTAWSSSASLATPWCVAVIN